MLIVKSNSKPNYPVLFNTIAENFRKVYGVLRLNADVTFLTIDRPLGTASRLSLGCQGAWR